MSPRGKDQTIVPVHFTLSVHPFPTVQLQLLEVKE